MRKLFLIIHLFVLITINGQRNLSKGDSSPVNKSVGQKTGVFIDVNTPDYPESNYNIDQLINEVLISGGKVCSGSVSNVKISPQLSVNNPRRSYGYFNKGTTDFPFAEGLVLMTGFAKNAGNFIIPGTLSGILQTSGDLDLAQAIGVNNNSLLDTTFIEFDFIPVNNRLSFTYIFASEEYEGIYPCTFTDGFALLIKKEGDANYTNLAILPNGGGPVSVTNIHDANENCPEINPQYYAGYNLDPEKETNFNGRSIPLTATTTVVPGQKYHFKMVLADFGDRLYDTGVFLKAGSFNIGVQIGDDNGNPLPDTISICAGTSKLLNAEVISPGVKYQWFFNGNIIAGATLPTYNATQAGTYKVEILLPNSVCPAEAQIIINIDAIPVISLTASKTVICSGESVVLTASGAKVYTFSGLSGTGNIQTVKPTTTTTYTVTGSTEGGCKGNSTNITITVVPPVVSTLKDVQFCEGKNVLLDAGAGTNYTYKWNTGATSQTITIDKEGIYTVTIDNGVCAETFSAKASYVPIPIIEDIIYIKNILKVIIKQPVSPGLEYSIDGGLTFQNSNVFTNITPNRNYLISVRMSGNLCEATTEFYTFFVSNVITPNEDGINDEVDFTSVSKNKEFKAMIFDRFGKEVFRASPDLTKWNGSQIRMKMATGAYWYQVFWIDNLTGKVIQKTGWILVKNRD